MPPLGRIGDSSGHHSFQTGHWPRETGHWSYETGQRKKDNIIFISN